MSCSTMNSATYSSCHLDSVLDQSLSDPICSISRLLADTLLYSDPSSQISSHVSQTSHVSSPSSVLSPSHVSSPSDVSSSSHVSSTLHVTSPSISNVSRSSSVSDYLLPHLFSNPLHLTRSSAELGSDTHSVCSLDRLFSNSTHLVDEVEGGREDAGSDVSSGSSLSLTHSLSSSDSISASSESVSISDSLAHSWSSAGSW